MDTKFRGKVVYEDYEGPSSCLPAGEDSITISGESKCNVPGILKVVGRWMNWLIVDGDWCRV